MLNGTRVLDLTDDRGHLAGLLLAQLGADVLLVEPPGGHRTRHVAPFVDDVAGPQRALEFLTFNRGKRSAVLDDPAQLAQIAASADVLIECGVFEIDTEALRQANPALITASITPFGQTGPKADWPATDLTLSAASGTTWLTGDRDRPPVRIGVPQTWHNAAVDTAGAVLIALTERDRSGLGQHVDTSTQESFVDCTQFQMLAGLVGTDGPVRLPGAVQLGEFTIPWVFACADGYVTVTFLFGLMVGPFTSRLLRWMHEEGAVDAELAEQDWIDFGMAVFEGRQSISVFDEAIKRLTEFVATKTKAELLERALADNLLIAPITTTADVMALAQLADRDYWQTVAVAGRDSQTTARFCGNFAKVAGRSELVDLAPAPELGSSELSFEERDERDEPQRALANARAQPAAQPPTPPTAQAAAKPLSDVKILDFMWALAGPGATRTLADYGATVVKIESETKPDVLRGVHPFIGEEGGQENALQFHSINAGKLDLTLDLNNPASRDVVLDLVRWADVLTESFSPKAMASWGLGYDELRKVNPQLVMFSSCLMGQTGPMRYYAGFGTMAAAIAGFYPVTGWPDRIPAGPFTAYTDYISPKLAVVLILAALRDRERSGEGCYIDFAQLEGALHFLAPQLLDEELHGRTADRNGNADALMTPHGTFACKGEERWLAVACETDAQWAALAEALGAPEMADLGVDARRARSDEIDGLISAWTANLEVADAEATLIAAGVPAHRVNDAEGLVTDPQLVARGHFVHVPHAVHGHTWVENSNFELSRTPGRPEWGGPMFGEHNMDVLEGILGYDGDKIAELVIAGALT